MFKKTGSCEKSFSRTNQFPQSKSGTIKKQAIRTADKERLRIIHEKIRIFNFLDADDQLLNLKIHLIDVGSKRRNNFRNNDIVFRDYSDSEPDSNSDSA